MAAYQLPIEEMNEDINFAQGEFLFVHVWEHRVRDFVEVHHHGWHEFVWNQSLEAPAEGDYEMILDGRSVRYGPGDLLYVPPYRDHAFVDQLGLKSAVIGIDPWGFDRLAGRSPVGAHFSKMLASWSEFGPRVHPSTCFLDTLLPAAAQSEIGHQLRIILELDRVLRLDGVQAEVAAPAGKGPAAVRDDLVRRALSYMEAHFQQALDVDGLVEHLKVGRSTLSRRFSACMGVSIPAYLQRIRIRHAMILLGQSNLGVLDIALECGFRDPSHFARTFRECMGLPPGQWRQEMARRKGREAKR